MNIEKMLQTYNYEFRKIDVPFESINNTIYIINERKEFYLAHLSCDIKGNMQKIINEIDAYLHDKTKNWDCYEFVFITDFPYDEKSHNFIVENQGMRISRIAEINHDNKTITYKNSLVFQTLFAKKFLKNLTKHLRYTHIKKD